MKKIFLFLFFSFLMIQANAMVFTDVGHKDTNKIEIVKQTVDQAAIVTFEVIQINKAIDVGWQQNYFENGNIIYETDSFPVLNIPLQTTTKLLYLQNSIPIYLDKYVSHNKWLEIKYIKFSQLQTFNKTPNPVL